MKSLSLKIILLGQVTFFVLVTFLLGLLNGLADLSLFVVFPMAITFFNYFIAGAVGLFLCMKFFKRKENRFFRFPLLITSVLLLALQPAFLIGLPIYGLGQYVGRFGKPAVSTTMNQVSEAKQNEDYETFKSFAGKSFTVKDVNDQYILTTDGYVFSLFGFYADDPEKFNKYAKELLLNKQITVILPPKDVFMATYTGHSGTFYDEKNKQFYDIPAFVYLDNSYLNEQFRYSGF